MPPDPSRVREVSLFAADLPPAPRQSYLDGACGTDAEFRAAVERDLAVREGRTIPVRFEPATPALSGAPQPETTDHHPDAVLGLPLAGKYKLLKAIGEGGMGSVWLAQQTEPVKRLVAVKLIKAGMDSKVVLARFEAERQALALMDHPNIATVLDAGATLDGRPFFVMELVSGVPITQFCDERKLTPRERLALFISVCQAIQHAHQKGIIHRDIKPTNVLITLYDDRPVPKVIDFGIAKATGPRLTEHTLDTAIGGVVGTPQYMSPEQATLDNLDIDTRSDVYSLGVLLYELLTGSPPFSGKDLEKAGLLEVLRAVREEEPARPSTRLSTAATLSALASNRGMEPGRLTRLLRRELDWVVMKALEKDRSRRYETANAFALDVQRYLDGEPVAAHPPSRAYRLRKFLRKHRGPAVAAGLLLLALAGGVVGTSLGLIEARTQRDLADEARRDEAAERGRAEQEAARARERDDETRAVLDFVERKVFAAARPEGLEGGLGHNVTLRRAVEGALPFVAGSFKDRPLTEARLRWTLGQSFLYLGEAKLAAEQFRAARALWAEHLGPDHPDTLRSMAGLAATYDELGLHQDAAKLYHEVIASQKARLGPEHPDTLRSLVGLSYNLSSRGDHASALKLRQEALPLQLAQFGPDHADTLRTTQLLGTSYFVVGRYRDAMKLCQEALAHRTARLGSDHPDTLSIKNTLAHVYERSGRHPEALGLREELYAAQKAKLGPDHPGTQMTKSNLANSLHSVGRFADALKHREESVATFLGKYGPDHPSTLLAMNNLAHSLCHSPDPKLRDPKRALEFARKAARGTAGKSGHRYAVSSLGEALYRIGDWKGAIPHLEKGIALTGPNNADNSSRAFFLAMAHWRLGDQARAREWFDKGERWLEKAHWDKSDMKRDRDEAAELLGLAKKY